MKRQAGLSMVELMVAMTLGLLLTAAVLQVFVGAKKTYLFQQEFSRIQENGRFAMSFLTRAIRQADFWGCLKNGSGVNSILNGIGGVDFTQGLDATDGAGPYTPAVGPVTDLIVIRGGREGGIPVINTPSATAATIKLDKLGHPNGGTIGNGDILLVTDCERGTLFQVTNTNAANNTVTHNSGGPWVPGNSTGAFGVTYGPDATVFTAGAQQFWIREGASGEPALVRGTDGDALTGGEELVEGIENMQLLLGYDDDGDGVVDFYAPPGQADHDSVVSVQISLIARSLRNNMTDAPVSLDYNGSSYTPPAGDRYLRKVFSTNITLRNRVD